MQTFEEAIYLTRCNIGWYSSHANAYVKPLEVSTNYATTLCVDETCRIPPEILRRCVKVIHFRGLWGLLSGGAISSICKGQRIFTGFDFPCMFTAWRLKRRLGCKWTMFLWDPPSLSYRDGFPPFRWAIDALFRFFAKRCDKLVLNIHPGLLKEIGYEAHEGQLELRMQDAFNSADFQRKRDDGVEGGVFDYEFGILSNWGKGKGGPLVSKALMHSPAVKCLWIGNPPRHQVSQQIHFVGHLPQDKALDMLRRCQVLVVPYLPTHALKWNYPLKLFEYLQLGRPILASDNPGNVAISRRFPGRISLFRSGDCQDLQRKMDVVLSGAH